jgi:hypothetical protein
LVKIITGKLTIIQPGQALLKNMVKILTGKGVSSNLVMTGKRTIIQSGHALLKKMVKIMIGKGVSSNLVMHS